MESVTDVMMLLSPSEVIDILDDPLEDWIALQQMRQWI